MALHCRTCGELIPAEDVNIELAIAKCRSCNAVFGFADRLGDADAPTRRDRAAVPMPKAITVEEWGRDVTIVRRWFSPMHVFLIFFCIAWDGFLVFWYFMALTEGGPCIMIVFPIAHVAIGVGLTYYTISGLLNRTVLKVASGTLTVRHGPLPWPGNHTIETAQLEQLYCTEHVSTSKQGGSTTHYRVNAALADGRKLRLLSGMSEVEQALFIEQKLEDHLGIKDQAVPGEMK